MPLCGPNFAIALAVLGSKSATCGDALRGVERAHRGRSSTATATRSALQSMRSPLREVFLIRWGIPPGANAEEDKWRPNQRARGWWAFDTEAADSVTRVKVLGVNCAHFPEEALRRPQAQAA